MTDRADDVVGVAGRGNHTTVTALVGARIHTPRNSRNAGTPSQSSNSSELRLFMLMHVDTKNLTEKDFAKNMKTLRIDVDVRGRKQKEDIIINAKTLMREASAGSKDNCRTSQS
jgi:hypothetical protein